MNKTRTRIAIIGLSAAAVVGVTVAVMTGGSASTPTAAASSTATATPPAPTAVTSTAAPTIHTAMATVDGMSEAILENGSDRPLYIYKPDTAKQSMVTGSLAALWPPVEAASPTAQGTTGTLSTVMTSNGSQVTYNGHFLYSFVEDGPGQVTGQGVQSFFVATPGISELHGGSPSVSMNPAPASSGWGY
jgi:predicted lipoprotein with Yx(FWY)xxD motif